MKESLIFISHSASDKAIVDKLIDMIVGCCEIHRDQISCTSTDGTGLPPGAAVEPCLLEQLKNAKVVIGVLTPNSIRSPWVMFELGASWADETALIPMLAGGVTAKELPGPAAGMTAVFADDPPGILDLLNELARICKMTLKDNITIETCRDEFVEFAKNFSPTADMMPNEIVFFGNPQEGIPRVVELIQKARTVLQVSLSPRIPSGDVTTKYDDALMDLVKEKKLRFTYVANSNDPRRVEKSLELKKVCAEDTRIYIVPANIKAPRINYWVIDQEFVVMAFRVSSGDDRVYCMRSIEMAQSMVWLTEEALKNIEPLRDS